MDIALFSINYQNEYHTPDPQPEGGMVRAFVAGRDDSGVLPARFGDMRCQFHAWNNCTDYDVLGFHGYRKHIEFSGCGDEPEWLYTSPEGFRKYQKWLAKWDGQRLKEMMKDHGVIVTPPFHVGCGMALDFARSRHPEDWNHLEVIMGRGFDYDTPEIHGTFWVMRREVFREYMEFWWDVINQLLPRLGTHDNAQKDYRARDVAFLSERIASLWIQRYTEKLKPAVLPLLISWDVK